MRILFAGWHNPLFMSITEYIEKALEKMGHFVEKFEYRQFSIPGRIRDRIPFLQGYDINRINKKFIDRAGDFRPDLVFVLQGTTILPETISEIKNRYKIPAANWFIDYPVELKRALILAKYYDFFFVSSTHAMLKHHEHGNNKVRTLNFACDPETNKPGDLNPDEKEKYAHEVVFVGSRYPEREEVLSNLTEFDLGIWGPAWDRIEKTSPVRGFLKSKNVGPEIWSKIYSSSKISLNINYGFGKLDELDCSAGSTKLFEIPACRGFQIVDRKKAITDIFEDGKHLVIFSGIPELKEKIKYYLAHPAERDRIVKEGHSEVLSKHTYRHRMEEMLSIIKA